MKRTDQRKAELIYLRYTGLTLRQAAAEVGVHVATICRWQVADPDFYAAMRDGERAAAREKYASRPLRRPRVRWGRTCPKCRASVEVRTASGGIVFWRCSLWPYCPWASWRPLYPAPCPRCKGPLYWSCSRKSIGCATCKVRVQVDKL
jgi:hypothetical protein